MSVSLPIYTFFAAWKCRTCMAYPRVGDVNTRPMVCGTCILLSIYKKSLNHVSPLWLGHTPLINYFYKIKCRTWVICRWTCADAPVILVCDMLFVYDIFEIMSQSHVCWLSSVSHARYTLGPTFVAHNLLSWNWNTSFPWMYMACVQKSKYGTWLHQKIHTPPLGAPRWGQNTSHVIRQTLSKMKILLPNLCRHVVHIAIRMLASHLPSAFVCVTFS